jgi:hypothetical protein
MSILGGSTINSRKVTIVIEGTESTFAYLMNI